MSAGCGERQQDRRVERRPRPRGPGRSSGGARTWPGTSGWARIRVKSRPRAFQWSTAGRISRRSDRPIISSIVRNPRRAMCSRTSCAMKRMKLTTWCGSPAKRLRSSGSWVATPTGQVLRWQARITTQPSATSGAVANPNSSAPSSAPTTTSRPVLSCPSTSTTIRLRRSFISRTWCVSARPELPRDAGVLDRGERRRARSRRRGPRSARRPRAPWRRPPRPSRRPPRRRASR